MEIQKQMKIKVPQKTETNELQKGICLQYQQHNDALATMKTVISIQLHTSLSQNTPKTAANDLNNTNATSKLLSILLKQSSCTGCVSLYSMAIMMLVENNNSKKSMHTMKQNMWRPSKQARLESRQWKPPSQCIMERKLSKKGW